MPDAPLIFWFRRDLRLDDNRGLHQALHSGQPVLPLFILDPRLQRGTWYSRNRMAWLLRALGALAARLRTVGGRLLVLEGEAEAVLAAITREAGASALYFNRDYSPFARRRDARVAQSLGIAQYSFDDNLLVPPPALHTADGKPYKAFTPFYRRWQSLEKSRAQAFPRPPAPFYDISRWQAPGAIQRAWAAAQPHVPLPAADEGSAQRQLASFISSDIDDYSRARNHLSIQPFARSSAAGPAVLSPYLRLGILSPRQVYWAAQGRYAATKNEAAQQSIEAFCRQLAWRDFFMHILFHFPHVRRGNFRREGKRIAWRDAPDELQAWQEGRTGYPIVDAAMRQLHATGWMPNRARMVVASFLCKHLLIDWPMGEAHFMRQLLDGDPAANNGGWQWVAGTGTDAQPWFRIFSPMRQSQQYDSAGRYIRHWLPQLQGLPARSLHEPWRLPHRQLGYPRPLVEHGFARARAIAAMRSPS